MDANGNSFFFDHEREHFTRAELLGAVGREQEALRAYRNYLRLRVDPEPSKIPQLDSVRAELRALGGLEGR